MLQTHCGHASYLININKQPQSQLFRDETALQ